jgi:hypothetical protein
MRRGLHRILSVILTVGTLATALPALAAVRSDYNVLEDHSAAIRRVIEQQLAAFRRDDAEEAFSYASPSIRHAFKDATTFMALVTKEYRVMTRWDAATFMELRTFRDHYVQKVKLIEPSGAVSVAEYALVKDGDGRWTIAGVTLQDQEKVETPNAIR